jgi:hypothetical protein
MNIEAAADVGVELARSIAIARRNGNGSTSDINRSLDRLACADGSTPLDALAFAVFARTLLVSLANDLPSDGEEGPSYPGALVRVAIFMLQRAVEALEQVTGYGAEAFTGEIDATN